MMKKSYNNNIPSFILFILYIILYIIADIKIPSTVRNKRGPIVANIHVGAMEKKHTTKYKI